MRITLRMKKKTLTKAKPKASGQKYVPMNLSLDRELIAALKDYVKSISTRRNRISVSSLVEEVMKKRLIEAGYIKPEEIEK